VGAGEEVRTELVPAPLHLGHAQAGEVRGAVDAAIAGRSHKGHSTCLKHIECPPVIAAGRSRTR
jgi:hypothetical protein